MTNHLQKIWVDARFTYYHASNGYIWKGAPRNVEHWTFTGHLIVAAWGYIVFLLSCVYCAIFGHDLEDESYGDPDGGCMAASCRRCGWSFHHTLY